MDKNKSTTIPAANSVGGKITADLKTGAMNKSTERDPISKMILNEVPRFRYIAYRFELLLTVIERMTKDIVRYGDDVAEVVLRVRTLMGQKFRRILQIIESVK